MKGWDSSWKTLFFKKGFSTRIWNSFSGRSCFLQFLVLSLQTDFQIGSSSMATLDANVHECNYLRALWGWHISRFGSSLSTWKCRAPEKVVLYLKASSLGIETWAVIYPINCVHGLTFLPPGCIFCRITNCILPTQPQPSEIAKISLLPSWQILELNLKNKAPKNEIMKRSLFLLKCSLWFCLRSTGGTIKSLNKKTSRSVTHGKTQHIGSSFPEETVEFSKCSIVQTV